MKIVKLITLSIFAALTACASSVNDAVGDPNFHVGTLQQSVLVIADINAEGTAFSSMPQSTMNTLAVNGLRLSRKDLQVFNSNIMYDEFSEPERARIVDAAERQFVSAEDKALLSRMAKAGDLVVFSRILGDMTESEESEHLSNVGDKTRRVLTRSTWRESSMQVDVYDVNQQKLVWSAVVDDREQNDISQERANGSFLENLAVDVLEAALIGGFPAAPSDQDMVSELFKKLGASLPQRSCKEIGFSECMKRKWEQS